MNAARVFASYLRSTEMPLGNQQLAASCQSLIMLVDFMRDVVAFYPAWGT